MHTMDLIRQHEGLEEWFCPSCGRHLLVHWTPRFERTIINEGDLAAGHNGFKTELQPESLEVISGEVEAVKPVDESSLLPWSVWMDKSDFADLWNDRGQ